MGPPVGINTHTSPGGGSGFRVSRFSKAQGVCGWCVVVIDEDQMRVCLRLASHDFLSFLESGVVPCGEIARLLERKPCTNSATPAVIV